MPAKTNCHVIKYATSNHMATLQCCNLEKFREAMRLPFPKGIGGPPADGGAKPHLRRLYRIGNTVKFVAGGMKKVRRLVFQPPVRGVQGIPAAISFDALRHN